ncbi:MAG TPA: S1-like domain-containing RNA-binding protein [Holophaga sp.]|jgi:predicted RNA-binding protein (virulence factor B family)|nr:S1-like domain-containing RNA-binding protein [Holophaga sp.]
MATLGILNDLKILRLMPEGAILAGGPDGDLNGELLLPLRQVPRGCAIGETLKVFVYLDGDGHPIATTQKPLAQRGEVANLKIVSTNRAGALLAWGLPSDLFLPWKEVKHELRSRIQEGQKVLVMLFADDDGWITASTRLNDFLSDEAEGFQEGDKVSLVIGDRTDIGVRVIVNHRFWGLIHESDIFGRLTRGEMRDGYIKALRMDHKLNIALTPPGYAKVDALSQRVLDALKRHGGFLPVTDKSTPEAIAERFGISKKAFKQTIGSLYKARRITIEAEGIRLAETPNPRA